MKDRKKVSALAIAGIFVCMNILVVAPTFQDNSLENAEFEDLVGIFHWVLPGASPTQGISYYLRYSNGMLLTYDQASTLERGRQSVFVEDMDGNSIGFHRFQERSDGRYDLSVWTEETEARLEIFGFEEKPERMVVRFDSARSDPVVEYVMYADSVAMEKAEITLPRSGDVSEILFSATFDTDSYSSESWESTGFSFTEDEGTVSFEVTELGVYGVAEKPDVFTVTTTRDSGAGSLKQAIIDANDNPGLDIIEFSIPADDRNHIYYRDDRIEGQVSISHITQTDAEDDSYITDMDPDHQYSFWSIKPRSELPRITDPVIMDGYTQPGAIENSLPLKAGTNTVLRIELSGIYAGWPANGLVISGGASTLRGLAVNNFVFLGIQFTTNGGNTVEGCFIGTDVSGTQDLGNFMGLSLEGVAYNTIGGTDPSARNIISGNDWIGLMISGVESKNNSVFGNLIGTNARSTPILGNSLGAVVFEGSGNAVGGAEPNLGNIIAGNDPTDVWISGAHARNNTVAGNFIDSEIEQDSGAQSNTVVNNMSTDDMAGSALELIFVDPSVPDYETLLNGLARQGIIVVFMNSDSDGMEFITESLSDYRNVTAIHILSHGDTASLDLGTTNLNADNMEDYAFDLIVWDLAMAKGADILLYGCSVANGEVGGRFVARMAELTGADTAASNDLTGGAEQGGDWELEVTTGSIETDVPFSQEAISEYSHILGEDTFMDMTEAAYKSDPRITALLKGVLVNGLTALATKLGSISGSSHFTDNFIAAIPALIDFVTDPDNPAAPDFGTLIGDITLDNVFQTNLVDEISTNFTPGTSRKASQLVSFMDGLDATVGDLTISVESVSYTVVSVGGSDYQLRFDLTFKVGQSSTYSLNLGRNADILGLKTIADDMPDIDVDTGFTLDLTFGAILTLTVGDYDGDTFNDDLKVQTVNNDFFIRDTQLNAEAHINESGISINVGGGPNLQVGFLEIEVEGGTFTLDGEITAEFVDPDSTDPITLTEITGTAVDDLVDMTTDGDFEGDLPVARITDIGPTGWSAIFGGLTLGITLEGDPFDPSIDVDDTDDPRTAPPITLSNDFSDFLLFFNNITPDGVLGLLQQFQGWLGSFGVSQLFSAVDIPFADAQTLANVLDFFTGFDDLVASTFLSITDPDEGITIVQFASVQELIIAVGNALGMTLSSIAPDFDLNTQELTFTLDFDPDLPDIFEIPIDFSVDLSPLAEIQTNVEVSLEPYVGFSFTLGIDLSTPSEVKISPATVDYSLRGLMDPDTGSPYTPANGQLTEDARFRLILGLLGSVDVTVLESDTTGNSSRSDLADDMELAIESELDNDNIEAEVEVDVIFGSRIRIYSPDTTFLKIEDISDNTTESEGGFELLGFNDSQVGSSSPLPRNGILSGTASFGLTVGQGSETTVNITQNTAHASSGDPISSLIGQIRTQVSAASGGDVLVQQVGDSFAFVLKPTSSEIFMRVNDPNNTAYEELGLRDEAVGGQISILGERTLEIVANALVGADDPVVVLDEDVTITLEVDGDPVTFTVHAAKGVAIGFCCNQSSNGVLTANKEIDDPDPVLGYVPGVDVSFELFIEDDSYIITIPKSITDANSDIYDMADDMDTAFTTAGIDSLVEGGTDASGKKLTISPKAAADNYPNTYLRVSAIGNTQDNVEVGDLVDDLNTALAQAELSDGTRLDRVVVGSATGEDTDDDDIVDRYKLILSVPSEPVDTLEITAVTNTDLGFVVTALVTVVGPPSDGQLSDDAVFSLTMELKEDEGSGTGPFTWEVTVTQASTSGNTSITDLIEDINTALIDADPSGGGSPEDISDRITAGLLVNKVTFSARDDNTKMLRTSGTDTEAQDELGLDDGITAAAREEQGFLFIRDVGMSGGVNLVVNTTDTPAVSAHFGFVGIDINTVQGTLGAYGTDVAVHGGVAIAFGGIKSVFELSTFALTQDASFDVGYIDNTYSVTLEWEDTIGNTSIGQLATNLQDAIDSELPGSHTVAVGTDGDRLTLTTSNGERLRLEVVHSDPAHTALGFANGQQTGRINLEDLTDATSDFDILEVLVNIDITGEAGLELSDVVLQPDDIVGGLLDELGIDPRIEISMSDFLDFDTISITGLDLGAIADGFDDFEFSDVTAALQVLLNLIADFADFDFLDEPLPVVGVTINDILDYIEEFIEMIEEMAENPASIVQDLEQLIKEALGLPSDSDAISLSLDTGSTILRIDLAYDKTWNGSMALDIDLVDMLGISLPDELINLSGAAGLEAEFSVTLGLGIDLDNPSNLYVYDNTGIFLEGYALADNVNFTASLGPFGIFITGGKAVFNEDGDTTNTNGAYFNLTAFEDPDTGTEGDRVELGDVDIQAELAAGVGAILPCYFPTASNFIGNLDFYISIALDLLDPTSIELDPHLNSYPDFTNILPDISSFGLIESLQLAVEGLDLLLYALEKVLGDDVLGAIDIPLIGDSIDDAAEFIEDVRREVIPELRAFLDDAPQKAIELIQQAIFYALGPPGLNLLVLDPNWHDDGAGNSSPDYRDVQYTYPPSEDMLQFNLQMGGHYAFATPEIDIGLPGLGFSLDGGIEVALDWDMLLCFGISRDDGFYLDTTPLDAFTDHLNGSEVTPQSGGDDLEHMFEISLSVTLPEPDPGETTMTGSLLFLQLDITNQNWPDPSLEAFFAVDVTSGGSERLGFASIALLGLDFDYGVQADLDLDMSLGVVGGDVFPHLDCNFQLKWGLGDGIDTEHPAIPYLAFNDVGLNLGSFFSEFLGPVIEEIQKVTKPLEPIIEVLTDPIPVISDLAGEDISLVDIAASFGLVDPGFIEAVADLISFINSIPTDGSDIIIEFGSFDVGGDGTLDLRVETALDAIRATPSSTPLGSVLDPDDFESLIDTLGDYDFSSSLSAGLSNSSASASTKSFASKWSSNQGGFSFPLFTDPGQVFGMFLGRSADVFFYDMPKFTFGFTYSQFFPIWDGLGAEISGTVGCSIDLSFGYDTFGIQKFADGGYRNPLDLLRGFYIGDIDFDTGADIPEVSVFGSLTGAAVLNLVVASVGVGGGVYATIDFNLNDPDGDGKVRIEEIIGNVCNGFKQLGIPLGLICIFDVTGKVWARLFAFIKIDLLFFKFKRTWYFGPSIPLVEFEYSCPKDPILATDSGDGVLRLNMGKYAQDRLYGNTSDGPEEFHVKWKSGDTVQVWSPSHGVGEGSAQEYSGVTKIMADTGQGNDIIDLSRVTSSSITSELRGDSGDDILISGAGEALFYGGVGNDILVGGAAEDALYGEEGTDTLIGNESDDFLDGDEDDDILNGDAGQDTLLGGDGDDLISGGGDGDVLRGGAGKDSIWGDSSFQFDVDYVLQKEGDGSPSLIMLGTEAEDHITGDGDPDVIYGEGGTDMISGGGGPDVIDAGSEADKVWGDSNFEFTDNVLQFDGPDPKTIYPLYSTAGGDIINGGSGADELIGEDGNDEIHGGDGNDEIYGDRGSDILYGDDDDDDIYGDLGNDRMFGNDGNDTMDGEGDNDVMFGDDGEVAIIAGQETLNLDLVRTINPTVGGDDEMDGGTGDDIMLGGPQTDTIYGGTGDDRLLGDNGQLDYTFFPSVVYSYMEDVVSIDLSYGDRDYIYGYEGSDMIIGGEGSDEIFGDAGAAGEGGGDVILGDNGHVDYTPDTVARWSDIALIETTDTAAATGGNDNIDASEGPDIVMGGVGADTIIGSLDDDILLGDSGLMDYDTGDADLSTLDLIRTTDISLPAPGGEDDISGGESSDIILGGNDSDDIFGDNTLSDTTVPDPGRDILIGDQGQLIFVNGLIDTIESTDSAPSDGDADTMEGNEEDDVIIGGVADDTLEGNTEDDIIMGDEGRLKFNVASPAGDDDPDTLDLIETHTPALGDADTIYGNEDEDIIMGGAAGDDIWGNTEDDVILGDNGKITQPGEVIATIETTDPSIGGSDTIEGNDDNDIILGGAFGDDIWGNSGEDVVLGDNGKITETVGLIDQIETTDPSIGGSDTIEGNTEDDIIMGGADGDDIWGHTGEDIILGDNGKITQPGAVIDKIETTDPAIGGSDTIEGNTEDDIIMGGAFGDDIWGNEGHDMILGDNGMVTMPDEVIEQIETTDPSIGGSDTIEGNSGDDYIMGGAAGDEIWGHEGEDVILGDNGYLDFVDAGDATTLDLIMTTDPAIGGSDAIEGNEAHDIIMGGAFGDDIWGHAGHDIILGDNGLITQPDAVIEQIETTDPAIGGSDTIEGNTENDIILGGPYGDNIWGHAGEDVILGDNGFMDFVVDADASTLDLIMTTDPAIGGSDTIEGNEDTDKILGGAAGDYIWGHGAWDLIMGDNGKVTQTGAIIEVIETTDSDIGGDDEIYGNDGDDIIMGGYVNDYIEGNADMDIILGDNGKLDYILPSVDGVIPDPSTLDQVISTFPNDGGMDTILGGTHNDIIYGGTASDIIYGNEDHDLIFGDHAKCERYSGTLLDLSTIPVPSFMFISIYTSASDGGDDDLLHGNEGHDIVLGGQGDDAMYGDEDDDDMIGGHNTVGGIDELDLTPGTNDVMDGGSGDDVMTGDNAVVLRRTDNVSPRFRALNSTTLYDSNDDSDVDATHQPNPKGAVGRNILMLDHSDSPIPYTYGDDYMAGGPDEDVMFGELGDDIMQGDSSVSEFVSATDPSVEDVDDDDDYIEGNGGDDLVFGNWGQDDITGGSSDLFGLTTPNLRPDNSDTIFGGAGTRIARNDPGDETDDGHANDSDVILGDNADIFRTVGTNGTYSGWFLSFTYDNYGTYKIIPRSVQKLDYTEGGDAGDIGNDDLIHGEASDDLIEGMAGNDVIFGEAQDDDIYGQSGHDRIYGGTGWDGILGDDGKIRTSRNSYKEPLWDVTKSFKETKIKLPGPFTGAWVNIDERLKKVADLAAFFEGGNDVLYGGLGDDWMHGGAGDDGMSGAEALPAFYNSNPQTNAPPLPYDPLTRKISYYDAVNPRVKIPNFFLNFEATDGVGDKIYDGKDRLFGDPGHDWLVGGTMNDRHFGGLGDDVINADDNHDSQGGLNNQPDDPEFADRDFSFGGAGLDVHIFNTGGDRSFDWIGEFNSYVAPYAPFGNPEVVRLISPHCVKFLLDLGEACGADQALIESDGELGLADQHDARWGDQHGAPRDPQAGNLPGVHRDTFGGPEDDR